MKSWRRTHDSGEGGGENIIGFGIIFILLQVTSSLSLSSPFFKRALAFSAQTQTPPTYTSAYAWPKCRLLHHHSDPIPSYRRRRRRCDHHPLNQCTYSYEKEFEWLKEKGTSTLSKQDILSPNQIQQISKLVQERSDARARGDYELADQIRLSIDETFGVLHCSNEKSEKDGGGVVVVDERMNMDLSQPKLDCKVTIRDVPRKEGGISTWDISCRKANVFENETSSNELEEESSVLKLAHTALGLASSYSERNIPIDYAKLDNLVLQAKVSTGYMSVMKEIYAPKYRFEVLTSWINYGREEFEKQGRKTFVEERQLMQLFGLQLQVSKTMIQCHRLTPFHWN